MKNFIKNIIALIFLGVVIFFFHNELQNVFLQLKNQYFPCQHPIHYSIGSFDEHFGISREDFLSSLKEAETIWEKSIDQNLFEYKEGGELKVNLIYDNRQASTFQLKEIDAKLKDSKSAYDTLKINFDNLKAEYQKDKSLFDAKVLVLKEMQNKYEKEVTDSNQKGGATPEQFAYFEQQKTFINNEIQKINEMQKSLNAKASSVNALVKELNDYVVSLNLGINKFNEVGSSNGEEFEEGVYVRDLDGTRIDIYQFGSKEKLIRILAHEMGHALGLQHIDDKEAIMYYLNNGINQKVTEADLVELKRVCQI